MFRFNFNGETIKIKKNAINVNRTTTTIFDLCKKSLKGMSFIQNKYLIV